VETLVFLRLFGLKLRCIWPQGSNASWQPRKRREKHQQQQQRPPLGDNTGLQCLQFFSNTVL